ncbi:MAG: hypothetical protein ABIP06_13945 [Pyrinomonadaceae bacterium]
MNIFEDLIEELKEENLLEETFTEVQRNENDRKNLHLKKFKTENNAESKNASENNNPAFETSEVSGEFPSIGLANENKISVNVETNNTERESLTDTSFELENPQTTQFLESDLDQNSFPEADVNVKAALNQTEFYKKRATDEVISLQMVEHVLSGVERDFLHITPKLYDDLEVTKSLHNFLQLSQSINSPEQAQAEFFLMQETESWFSALAQKDKNINIGNLRRYCETTRPALSSQALAALAKFYRNAPFSGSVRNKFDLVMTRFFSRETGGDIRQLLFDRDEIIENLNKFYADWSSIPLYATDEDESSIVIAAMKFEDFMAEAESAENFEDLLRNDFFERIKIFKESTNENFFAPLVIATSIECNVRIGNRYIELLLKEQENSNTENLEEKFGAIHNQIISEVVCKTIQITNVFQGKFAEPELLKTKQVEPDSLSKSFQLEKQNLNNRTENKSRKVKNETQSALFKVNKWLLAATILVFVSSIGLYLWVEYFNPPPKLSDNVKVVNLENSSLKEFVQTARISGDMFYGIVEPGWNILTTDKKEEFLRKIILVGGEKSFVKVTLMNKQGRTVGYASPEKVETYNP